MVDDLTILYPLCPSHSGSTLFSILIGSQENICGVGELFVFSDRPKHIIQKKEEKCSCNGKVKEQCPFWQKVEEYLLQNYQIGLDELNVESKDQEELKLHNQYLFRAIAEVTNCSIIVDASKITSRFVQLREAGFKMVPLVFKRNPCALVHSWTKRDYDWRQVAQYYPDYYRDVAKSIPDRKSLSVTYESFITNPSGYLKKLLQYLNLSTDNIELDWTKNDYHTLKGNAVRFQKNAALKPRTEWKTALTRWQKTVISIKAFSSKIDHYWFYLFWSKLTRLILPINSAKVT